MMIVQRTTPFCLENCAALATRSGHDGYGDKTVRISFDVMTNLNLHIDNKTTFLALYFIVS
jgi:hypothetical protein